MAQRYQFNMDPLRRVLKYIKDKQMFTIGNVQKNLKPQPNWNRLSQVFDYLVSQKKLKKDRSGNYTWVKGAKRSIG